MNYRALMLEVNGGASDASIAAVEKKLGVALPADYVEFLKQSDGGSFKNDLVFVEDMGDETVLNSVFGVAADGDMVVLNEYADYRKRNRIPKLGLPIGDDPGGNLFILCLEQPGHGGIYYWNHEKEPPNGGDKFEDFRNLHLVNHSFSAFIASLKGDS